MNDAPAIMKANYRSIKSSDGERVKQIFHDRENSKRAMQEDYDRGIKANEFVFALSGMQWYEKERKRLSEEDRYAYQFNVLTPKLYTMAGAMITDLPDVDWSPIEGARTTGTEAVKSTFHTDKEQCNWRWNLVQHFIGMLTHDSWIQMVETKKYHPLGNIGLEWLRPGSFVPSAYWKSNNDRDCKEGYKSTYLTAEGIKFKYEIENEMIRAAIDRIKLGKSLPPRDIAEQQQRFQGQIGDEYEVIEHFWLEMKKEKRLIGRKAGQFQWVPFPISDDQAYLEQFAEENSIDWDTVEEQPYDDMIQHVTAIAPSLDPELILYDAKTRVQVKGLSFFHSTTQRYKGMNKGLAESIMDLQATLNKRISLETELIEKANGGSTLVNKDLFDNPKDESDFKRNANKAGKKFLVDLDNVTKTIEQVHPADYPSAVMTQVQLMFDTLLPVISQVSDSWSSESQSGESGVLNERKIQINKIATLVYDEAVKQLMNNIGEAYFYQWQITYGDVEREINIKGGRERLTLNEQIDENGTVRNAVQYTPRCQIIVKENPNSPTKRTLDRQLANEALTSINPEINPLMYQDFMKIYIGSIEHDDETKMQFEADMELEAMQARTSLISRIAQNTAAMSGAALQDMQAKMALASQGQQQPQGAQIEEQVTTPEEQVQQIPNVGRAEQPLLTAEAGEQGI